MYLPTPTPITTNFYKSLATEEDNDDATVMASNCGGKKQEIRPTTQSLSTRHTAWYPPYDCCPACCCCYRFSCGYDVDHDGYHCLNQKLGHIPNVPQDEAHTVYHASMKAQHRTLPDGSGAGKGWHLAQNLRKANFVMDQRENWKR